MNETPIDPINLRAEIEMLQGQTRAMRRMIAALIVASENPRKVIDQLRAMQADLELELSAHTSNPDQARQLKLWKIGATGALQDLHAQIPQLLK